MMTAETMVLRSTFVIDQMASVDSLWSLIRCRLRRISNSAGTHERGGGSANTDKEPKQQEQWRSSRNSIEPQTKQKSDDDGANNRRANSDKE
jgi:hypothetical protein